MLRIFEPVLKNASKELLHGSHTRSISITTPSNSGIMKFAKKQLSCVGCKVPIRYFAVPCLKIILGSCKLYAILDSRFLICICFYVFQVPYHLIVCSCNLVYLIPWDLLINFRFTFNQQWNTMRKLQGKRSRVVLQKCVTRYATIIPVSTDFLIYQEYLKFRLNLVADLEEVFGRLWTQCQECQGSLHQDVLCTRFAYLFDIYIKKDFFFNR